MQEDDIYFPEYGSLWIWGGYDMKTHLNIVESVMTLDEANDLLGQTT
jgi:hypothetical protein